jgi:chromosome partitioning protein
MRTIAVVARKGGSGKTTVAVHLAFAAMIRGCSNILADIDPQRSASEVCRRRRGNSPELAETSGSKLFALQMSSMKKGLDLLIIDTASGGEEETASAIVLADLCVMIVRPTFLDLTAAIQTADMVRRLRKPIVVVLNQAPPQRAGVEPTSVVRALKALELLRLPAAPAILRSRSIYQTSLEQGLSAEQGDDPIAAEEMCRVMDFLLRLVLPQAQLTQTGVV